MAGRPTKYSQEIANKICDEIAMTSKSLKTICKEEGMPSAKTVLNWLSEGDREDGRKEFKEFLRQYTRSKSEQADFLVEEMLEIADDGSNDLMTIQKGDKTYEAENKEVTNRSRLRVDTRKWIASKLKPKKYGERQMTDITTNGESLNKESKITLSNGTVIEL